LPAARVSIPPHKQLHLCDDFRIRFANKPAPVAKCPSADITDVPTQSINYVEIANTVGVAVRVPEDPQEYKLKSKSRQLQAPKYRLRPICSELSNGCLSNERAGVVC
jgi:hypothetical protein